MPTLENPPLWLRELWTFPFWGCDTLTPSVNVIPQQNTCRRLSIPQRVTIFTAWESRWVTFSSHLSFFLLKDKLRVSFALFPPPPSPSLNVQSPFAVCAGVLRSSSYKKGAAGSGLLQGSLGCSLCYTPISNLATVLGQKLPSRGAYLLPLQAHSHPTVPLQLF